MQTLLNTTMHYGTKLYQSFDQVAAKAKLPPTISAPLFFVLLITISYVLLNFIISKTFSIIGLFKQMLGRKRDLLLVVGPTSSGKTSLLYRLALKRNQATVTSYQPNEVVLRIEYIEGNRRKSANIKAIDVPGQGHFRQQIHQRFNEVLGIMLVVDATSRQQDSQASELLYDILNSYAIRRESVPVLVACNKQDLTDARKAPQLEKDLESEIEQIKNTRKATIDEQTVLGPIDHETQAFTFSTLKGQVQFAECSVTEDKMDDVLKFVQNLCA